MTLPPFDPDAAALAGSGIFGLPHTAESAKVILIPVPFEATTSYGGGASRGPQAIVSASRQVDLFDVETGRPYEPGIAMLDEPAQIHAWNEEAREAAGPVIAAGGAGDDAGLLENLALVNDRGARLNEWVYETARRWIARGRIVGVVGGDHAVPFGAIRAAAEATPGLGVLHLDAHADLRSAYEGFTWSHASIMFNVCERIPQVGRLVQVGVRDLGEAEAAYIRDSGGRVVTHFDAALSKARLSGVPWTQQVERIVRDLPQSVYLSFDIDGLDPTLCPHTGTPVPGGLSFAEVSALIAAVAESGRRIVGFDLDEVAPGPDGDEWDGNVGARLLYRMIGWTLRSQALIAPP